MNKKKLIRIRNPHFKRLRDNLRIILIKSAYREWDGYFSEQEKILYGTDGKPKQLTPEEGDIFRALEEKKAEVRKVIDRSICMYPVCQKTNEDMIFNPVTRVWFCAYCYAKNQEFYKHDVRYSRLFP